MRRRSRGGRPGAIAVLLLASAGVAVLAQPATAQPVPTQPTEAYETWPVLKSTFPSTGGGGITIKGYDPVITGARCVTTFMAVDPAGAVYSNVAEFDAVSVQGGTLCTNGRWRAFEGGATGTTPFRVFFKDGVFRGSP